MVALLALPAVRKDKTGAMTGQELRAAGFDFYTFATDADRQKYKIGLAESGVTFEVHENDEEVAHTQLFFLAVKRTSSTLKQRLEKFPRGD